MNAHTAVEHARPDVGPMPVDQRRQVRERLFDVAPGPTPPTPSTVASPGGNGRRLAAVVLLAVSAVGALAFASLRNRDDSSADSVPTTVPAATDPSRVVDVPAPTSAAPTTTAPPVAGSPEAPLLMPVGRARLDALQHTPRPRGQSAVLLRAPDGSTIGLLETDGLAPEPPTSEVPDDDEDTDITVPETVPWENAGNVRARQIITADPDLRRYEVELPCGTLEIADGDGFPDSRPEIAQLVQSMSIDGGRIVIDLPDGWEVVSSGGYAGSFELGLPVDVGGRSTTFDLTQYPESGIAVAAYGGPQLEAITFLGQPAWLGRDLDDPSRTRLIGTFGETAFVVEVDDLTIADIETVMLSLEAGSIDEWVDRFGALNEPGGPDIRSCVEQPSFVVRS